MIGLGAAYSALATSIIAVTVAQLVIKWRFNTLDLAAAYERGTGAVAALLLSDWGCWLAGFLMLGGAALWYLSMTRLPLHFLLPAAALISPLASIAAYFLLGEALTVQKVMAILVITAGVTWLGLQQT